MNSQWGKLRTGVQTQLFCRALAEREGEGKEGGGCIGRRGSEESTHTHPAPPSLNQKSFQLKFRISFQFKRKIECPFYTVLWQQDDSKIGISFQGPPWRLLAARSFSDSFDETDFSCTGEPELTHFVEAASGGGSCPVSPCVFCLVICHVICPRPPVWICLLSVLHTTFVGY